MPEEWLEVAHINFDEVLVHGRITEGRDGFGVRQEQTVKQWLSDEQRERLQDFEIRFNDERTKLLKSFVLAEREKRNG